MTSLPPRLLELVVGGSPSPWISLGLIEESDHRIAGVGLRFDTFAQGLTSWTIHRARSENLSIDGIATSMHSDNVDLSTGRDSSTPFCGARAVAIDHVVVNTDDLQRTSDAFTAALGTDLRRVRDAGRGVMQGFHVLDNTVIEIVSGPHVSPRVSTDDTTPVASLWGFVVVVDDIVAVAESLGEYTSPPKPAVQPGRMISSVRSEAGLGVQLAIMSPR